MPRTKQPLLAWANDVKVHCLVCAGEQFTTRQVLLNSAAFTFFGLDFMNRKGTGLICCSCGYVMTFVGDTISVDDVPHS